MPDRGRGQARQPKPSFKQQRHFQSKPSGKPDRKGFRPPQPKHSRTSHELDPRKLAYAVLSRLTPGDLLDEAVETELRRQGHEPGLAHRILPMLEDATRFALLFDALIAHVSTRPPAKLDRDVRAALHLFLSWYLLDSPQAVYAHGQAAVDLLPPNNPSRGFVNACVRRLGEFVQRVDESDHLDPSSAPFWREKARLGHGRFVVAKLPIFPDPEKDLAGHLAAACGLDRWFIDVLLEQHGPQGAKAVALASIQPPPLWVRVNRLKANPEELAGQWKMAGLDVERQGDALRLPEHTRIVELPGFAAGAFYVQDFTSQQVAPALGAKPGETLLDLCAAPGGKTGHLAELTGDRAKILACDVGPEKVERIQENVARMGYQNVATVLADARSVRFPERFDRVLIDAPCSNSGVLGRRVEARHRLNAATVRELTQSQAAILGNAARNLKPGGTLLYSVCSVLMEEGVDITRKFMASRPHADEPGGEKSSPSREDTGWEMKVEHIVLPRPGHSDGMYWAVLKAPQ
ncbi:MAG: methyltransferase domain-containing protein [Planctomycetaceae bacterium]|nr:methyltransferase domain-containing protein [Planctomycetaceae bacterium]